MLFINVNINSTDFSVVLLEKKIYIIVCKFKPTIEWCKSHYISSQAIGIHCHSFPCRI